MKKPKFDINAEIDKILACEYETKTVKRRNLAGRKPSKSRLRDDRIA